MLKNNKILNYIISITFIFGMLLTIVHTCCFNENFYTKQHDKLLLYGKHISEYIGISDDELKDLTHFTLEYLNNEDASLDKIMKIKGIDREVFTIDEKLHMVDVRKLNITANRLGSISILLFIICFVIFIINKSSFYLLNQTYKKVLLYTLIIFSFIALFILLDFDSFWTLFHKIFFTGNDLWLLDLRKDILIMIVPPEFFNNLVSKIVIEYILTIVIFGFILKYLSRKKFNND